MAERGWLARFRAWRRAGGGDPYGHFGAQYRGTYEPDGSSVLGTISDPAGNRFPPVLVEVRRHGEVIGSTTELSGGSHGWGFQFEVHPPITPQDLLREVIRVFAYDRRGVRSEIAVEGAVQLSYVREVHSPSVNELVIDFVEGGNSKDYVLDGWWKPEKHHTWTQGLESKIGLRFANPGAKYGLAILASPLTVPDKLMSQRLSVWLDDVAIGTRVLFSGLKLIEIPIPSQATQAGHATLRFEQPDAAKPCDLSQSTDSRVLALAFKELKLKRFIDSEDEGRQPE